MIFHKIVFLKFAIVPRTVRAGDDHAEEEGLEEDPEYV